MRTAARCRTGHAAWTILALALTGLGAQAEQITWVGPENGLWSTSSNWDPAGSPEGKEVVFGVYSEILIPAIAVACAVLVSRWPQKRLSGARRKTKVAILVVLLVLAFLPLRFRITTSLEMPPVEWVEMD